MIYDEKKALGLADLILLVSIQLKYVVLMHFFMG